MSRRSSSSARRGPVRALVAAVLAAVIAAPTAAADFYTPPATLPSNNGDVIRSEPSTFYLDPLRTIRSPATVHRIMYRSTNAHGDAIAVTGTVLTPSKPWLGRGRRPVVGFAVGTQGLGEQCAPSRQLAAGSEYEGAFILGLLERGYGVAVSDYQGLGTPDVHTYGTGGRRSQAEELSAPGAQPGPDWSRGANGHSSKCAQRPSRSSRITHRSRYSLGVAPP